MSEYTSTTEEMRENYIEYCAVFVPRDEELQGAEFDRWLAEVERAVGERAWGEGAHAQWRLGQSRLVSEIPVNPYRRNEGENDGR